MHVPRIPKSTSSTLAVIFSVLLYDSVQARASTPYNSTQTSPASNITQQVLSGFEPCDALISANLSHAVHMPSSPLYDHFVKGSWNSDVQRSPFCFVVPSTSGEVSTALTALNAAGDGAGDWHIAIRSGGHGKDNQNSITNGVIIDLTYLNATSYNKDTNIAGVGTGARWGQVYSDMQKHGVSVTGGRQSIVGVGGLILGGGVGWHVPRRGFACDNVMNYEVVLVTGEIVNANASSNNDLYRALKGGSSNFGIVTRFDMDAFPAQNLTLERRTVGAEHANDFIDAMVGFTNLDKSYQNNAMVSVVSYTPQGGAIGMTVTEVNSVNDRNTTAFDAYNRIPLLVPSNKQSYTLPAAAAVDAPELTPGAQTIGAGAKTIANDPQIVRFVFQEHEALVKALNATFGPKNFSTILEFQPLPAYYSEIGVQRGGNMLGLQRNAHNRLYYALGATLLTPSSVAQLPQVYQQIAATVQRIDAFAKSVGGYEDFEYLPYADSAQNPLGSYGAVNVQHMKQVAKKYDPEGFFQRRVPGGFKISRVN